MEVFSYFGNRDTKLFMWKSEKSGRLKEAKIFLTLAKIDYTISNKERFLVYFYGEKAYYT